MVVVAPANMASIGQLSDLPDIPDSPHQPGAEFMFPKRSFGKKNISRSFQHSCFRQWSFLHYDEKNDLAYCHTCVLGF